jgi:hypothetical protein
MDGVRPQDPPTVLRKIANRFYATPSCLLPEVGLGLTTSLTEHRRKALGVKPAERRQHLATDFELWREWTKDCHGRFVAGALWGTQ